MVKECSWMSGICSRLHHSTYCCGDFKRSPPLISQPCRFRSAVKSGSFPPGEAKNSEDFSKYHSSKRSVAWASGRQVGDPYRVRRKPLDCSSQWGTLPQLRRNGNQLNRLYHFSRHISPGFVKKAESHKKYQNCQFQFVNVAAIIKAYTGGTSP